MIIGLLIALVAVQVATMVLVYFTYLEIRETARFQARINAVQYQQAAETITVPKASGEPRKTKQAGRSIVPQDELVDLADLDPETGIKAIEEYNQ